MGPMHNLLEAKPTELWKVGVARVVTEGGEHLPHLTNSPLASHFRPELELLLCACRIEIDEATASRIQTLLGGNLDWSFLANSAATHHVKALLFRSLNRVGANSIPPEFANAARVFWEGQRKRNLFLAAELVRILTALEKRGIAAIPFKGPVLTHIAYGDLGLRSFADLDFLIQERDILGCLEVLRELDYDNDNGGIPEWTNAFQKYAGQDLFRRKDRRVAVEPHWTFAQWTMAVAIDYPGIWQRAERINFAGTQVLNLSTEDLVTILCVHGSKELWSRLQWICDVAEVLRVHPSVDWDAMFERARSQGCLRMLLLGLTLANRLSGAMLPVQAEALLAADRTVVHLAGYVEQSLFSKNYAVPSVYQISRFRLLMRDRLKDKISYLFRTMTTPRLQHFSMIPLPRSLFFGYYPVKLFHDYLLLPL